MAPARFPDGTETRGAPELRAGSGRTLAGLAAVWDTPTRIADLFTETVRRGAFTESLASGREVFLLGHHDWQQPLARLGNGSLSVREGVRGLEFEATLPETRAADDILALARAGVIAGCSFAFKVNPDGGERWVARDRRDLLKLDLIEVSAVAAPAYPGTSVAARAFARGAGFQSAAARVRRMRLLELA